MKIGLIIYSKTGNTLSVANKLQEALIARGHSVNLERVTAVEDPHSPKVMLKSSPDASAYDAVIFGAPVQAFSLSPIMKAYLTQLSQINGKKIACFVTEHFPKAWMGGSQAIRQMTRAIRKKSANVTINGVVNWSGKTREEQIADVVTRLSNI